MTKKITAVVLALAALASALIVPVYAAKDVESEAERGFYRFADRLVGGLAGGIAALIKSPDWESKAEYVPESENFYKGTPREEFLSYPAPGARWSVGYDEDSLLTKEEFKEGEYYVGGSLTVQKKFATDIWDELKIRTVAISDGRGVSLFSSLDAFGLPNVDVKKIRAEFNERVKTEGIKINSVNVSSMHQHSCVDTLGLNGDILDALFVTPFRNLLGIEAPSGKNKEFMEKLYKTAADSMERAVADMRTGRLYYGAVDAERYIYDKRAPMVFDKNLNRLRFVPDDPSAKETWIVNYAIHPVGHGAAGTVLTADFPYFLEKYINETAGANVFQIQGAQLAITSHRDGIPTDPRLEAEYDEKYAGLAAYGEKLGELLCSIGERDETPVKPIFNVRHKEAFVPIGNNILLLVGKCGLLTNKIVKNGPFKLEVVTEIGYAEIGTDLAVAIMPGELAPEIAFGGAETAAESWDGKDWPFSAFCDAAKGRKTLVFGLTNDQIGYILPDNEWRSTLTENEEAVSPGPRTGSAIVSAWLELYNEVR